MKFNQFKSDNPMRRYNIGFAILSVIVLVIVSITVIGNASIRSDNQLESAIRESQGKISTYIQKNTVLPKVPLDAGITDTKGFDYKVIDESRYMLCATYKTKSDGYITPDLTYLEDVKAGVQSANISQGADTHYTNGETGYGHEKGYVCTVYSPYQLDMQYLRPYQVCKKARYKSTLGNQKVISIDAKAGKIGLVTSYIYSYPSNPGSEIGTPTYQMATKNYVVATGAKIYDNSCKAIDISQITVGTRLNIYQNDNSSLTIDAIKLEANIPVPATTSKPAATM